MTHELRGPICVLSILIGSLCLPACDGTISTPGGGDQTELPPVTDPDYCSVAPRVPGQIRVRRLTNDEYENTLRDLIGIASGAASEFPEDPVSSSGFLNSSSALGFGESRMEAMSLAAASASRGALAPGSLAQERDLQCDLAVGEECVRQFLESFGRRAFRRPLELVEIDRLYALYSTAQSEGLNEQSALEHVVQAILMSPNFLLRIEADSVDPTVRDLDGWALASRLSYFLWQTMPDDALFDAAADGTLVSEVGVQEQVERMLADEKAEAFYEQFALGWLHLRHLEAQTFTDDYPFDEELREAMEAETFAFIRQIVESDRPLSDLLTADFVMVNDRLAAHYGMPAVGTDVLTETPAPENRSGIFGLASVLSATSSPNRTSPVKRGAWMLESVLCAPPPPPPPTVEGFPDANETARTVRERLAQHRADPACAGCHDSIDPLGLALENFDAIGRYRAEDNGETIDATGELPTGEMVDGSQDLSAVLASDTRVAACMSRKLLSFALGRAYVRSSDQCHVEDMVGQVQDESLTLREVIVRLIMSDAFRRGGTDV